MGDIRSALRADVNPERAVLSLRYFKCGPGEYAEGDKFLGTTVPQQRAIAKRFKDLPLPSLKKLLESPWHEERLTALFILVGQYQRGSQADKKAIYDLYMAHTKWVNNWDLVDSSACYIVGPYLENNPGRLAILQKLASSELLWERRIAILSTFHYLKLGRADEALIIGEQLLYDKHDLIQKAVGWMLRELGKRVDQALLVEFLERYGATMPRTTLRYAVEHFTSEKRAYFLGLARNKA